MSDNRKKLEFLKEKIEKASYAKKQEDYEEAYHAVFRTLDDFESVLENSRYLEGDLISDTDRDFYEILIRFDTVYYFRSGLNKKRISEYENLWDYARALYSVPEFRSKTDFETIKKEEYLKDPEYDPLEILPLGPDVSEWEKALSSLRSR